MIPMISIFVSCYNEQETIIPTIETIVKSLKKLNISWEILVIDDCSNDYSAKVVDTFITENKKLPISLMPIKSQNLDKGQSMSII